MDHLPRGREGLRVSIAFFLILKPKLTNYSRLGPLGQVKELGAKIALIPHRQRLRAAARRSTASASLGRCCGNAPLGRRQDELICAF